MQLLKLRYLQLKRDLGYWVFIIVIIVFYLAKEISKDVLLHVISLAGIFIFFYSIIISTGKIFILSGNISNILKEIF